MKNCNIICFLWGLLTLIMVSNQGIAQSQWINLFGTIEDDKVKLYWEARDWPGDLTGFYIKKRALEGRNAGTWVNLHNDPITPEILPTKDWANQGLNEDQVREMNTKATRYFDEGLNELSASEVLQVLKARGGPGSGDRIKMKADFDFALLSGFAFVDNDYDDRKTFEYGIFYVDDNGQTRSTPLSTYETIEPVEVIEGLQVDLEFGKLKQGIIMRWKVDQDAVDQLGIHGFHVYRATPEGGQSNLVIPAPLGKYKVENNQVWWQYVDESANNAQDYTYTVAPLNTFQEELPGFSGDYEADRFKTLEPPMITDHEIVEDTDIKVMWTVEDAKLSRIKGFRIQRKSPGENTFINVSQLLDRSIREFRDTEPKAYGRTYAYRLVTVDNYDQEWYSPFKSIYYLGLIKPPALTGLQASIEKEDGNVYVKLSWDGKSGDDALTKGYTIYTDELQADQMVQLGSLPIIHGNEYKHKIDGRGGRDYTFKVVPVSWYNAEGEGQEISVYVNALKMPLFSQFDVELLENNRAKLTWQYPDIQELLGFNIYMNNQRVTPRSGLTPSDREFIVENIAEGENELSNFQIEAKGVNGLSRWSIVKSLLLPNLPKGQGAKPQGLKVKLLKEGDESFALLEWNDVNLESAGLLGYVLYVDYSHEGIPVLMAAMPLIKENQFKYKLPNMDRSSYTFRVAPFDEQQEIGPYAEVKLQLGGKGRQR